MGCSLPCLPVHGILQARVLEWVTISFSKGSSRPRDEPPGKPIYICIYIEREIFTADSHCCVAEPNAILQSNYPPNKNLQRKDTISIMQSHSFKYHLCADHPPPAPSCILNTYVSSLLDPSHWYLTNPSNVHLLRTEKQPEMWVFQFEHQGNSRQIYRISHFSFQQLEGSSAHARKRNEMRSFLF